MATDILYNSVNVFSGVAPTPFVERSLEPIRYGSKWGTRETFSLNGQITGQCDDGLEEIINKSNIILTRISPISGSLQIIDDGTLVIDKPYAKVRSFNLEEDISVGVKPFTIEFEAYEENFFTGSYGVLDPVNTVSYEETNDGEIIINRSCSARGFDTDSLALQNAIDYVESAISNFAPVLSLQIEKNGTISTPVLVGVEEEINRLEGSYSLSKRYLCNAKSPNSGFVFQISYKIEYSETEGVYQISADGSMVANLNSTISDLRNAFSRLDLYALCRSAMFKYNGLNINPNPISLTVNEVVSESRLDFNISFDTDLISSDVDFLYDTAISLDALTDLCSVSFDGTIRGRRGQSVKWARIKSFYDGLNIASICQSAVFNEFIGDNRTLQLHPSSFSVDFNEREGVISINASFAEVHKKNKWSHLFRSLDYSLNFDKGLKVRKKVQTVKNGSKAFDMNSRARSSCSISGSGILVNCDSSYSEVSGKIKNMMQSIFAENLVGNYFVESISITEDLSKGAGAYSFEMSVSYFDSSGFLGD